MLISTKDKDPVELPVKMNKVDCMFLSCTYTTDTRSGTEMKQKFLLQFHMEREHPAPNVVLVERVRGQDDLGHLQGMVVRLHRHLRANR